jgi:hypothetical protein
MVAAKLIMTTQIVLQVYYKNIFLLHPKFEGFQLLTKLERQKQVKCRKHQWMKAFRTVLLCFWHLKYAQNLGVVNHLLLQDLKASFS